jgi:short subunit dehydrogenase-like uncharacterized protein
MTGSILLYGATGYTGKLIAREARAKGASAVLAGRNPNMLKAVAKGLDLPWRSFDLADQKKVDAALKGVSVVLNAAGPFSATARPIADACLRQGPHYLDITGEIDVFEGLFARDAEAQRAGVTLMPGVGFDVVPSDCLAAHLKHRLPDATHLTIYLSAGFNVSRGTAKTAIEGIADGVRARRNGRLVTLARPDTGSCNFGKGLRRTIQIPWGDLSTAFHSTGIPNIEVHVEAPPALQALALTPAFVRSLLALPPAQAFLKALANRQPEGPSDEARCRARAVLVGVARNAKEEALTGHGHYLHRGHAARRHRNLPLRPAPAADQSARAAGGPSQPARDRPSHGRTRALCEGKQNRGLDRVHYPSHSQFLRELQPCAGDLHRHSLHVLGSRGCG